MTNPEEKRESQPLSVERTHDKLTFIPYTDIYETDSSLVLLADMPGVDEKDIDIQLEKEILSIKGNVNEPKFDESYRLVYSEFQYGDFERNFTVGNTVDTENIQASLKNGVLKVVLPKVAKKVAKKIAVKSE